MTPVLSITQLGAEICVITGICIIIALECTPWRRYIGLAALATVACTGCTIVALQTNIGPHGMCVHDRFTTLSQSVSLILIGLPLLWNKNQSTEWIVLLLSTLLGALLTLSSNDFLLLFCGLELMSIPLYAMIATQYYKAQEGALKYIILSALMSGLYLYGVSWIYGLTGSTHFDNMRHAMALIATDTRMILALAGVLAALAFKCAIAPFHIWIADVYHGAPTPVLNILVGAPKWTALMVVVRLIYEPFSALRPTLMPVLEVAALASMMIGALMAVKQSHVKRLLAYSSVGHMGFALLGISTGHAFGSVAAAIYVALYSVTLTVAVGVWQWFKKRCTVSNTSAHSQQSLHYLAHMPKYGLALVWVLLLLSMAGLPPTPGFLAKWIVFKAILQQGKFEIACVAAFYSIISLAYTLNIVCHTYHTNDTTHNVLPTHVRSRTRQRLILLCIACTGAILLCLPQLCIRPIQQSIHNLKDVKDVLVNTTEYTLFHPSSPTS